MENQELVELETSLRNFFFDSADSVKGQSVYAGRMKYRGLTLKMDNANKDEPSFKVSIGAFEAVFRLSDGLKIYGSLAGDEKIVMKWFYRGANQSLLRDAYGKNRLSDGEALNRNCADVGLNMDSNKS